MPLKVDYVNQIPSTATKIYDILDSSDSLLFEDIKISDQTVYTEEGDSFGAADINATNTQVNANTQSISDIGEILGDVTVEQMAMLASVDGDIQNQLDDKAPIDSATMTGLTRVNSLGVGTAASGTAGEIRATNNITAYYSDERLKDFHGTIPDALKKVLALNGYLFTENAKAKEMGYNNDKMQVGVSAQEVMSVLPEIVTDAPIGNGYLSVWYEKLTPLLIEAIKEQQKQIDELKRLIGGK